MKLKGKLSFSKFKAAIIGLACIAVSCFIFQGCEKDEYNSPDWHEIINSTEFEEYIAANVELVSVYQKANTMLKNAKVKNGMKTGVSPEGATYRTCPFKIDQHLLKDVSAKRAVFLRKYPSFKTYGVEGKKDLIKKTMVVSKTINELLFKKGLNIKEQQLLRLKSGSVEGAGIYTYDDYMNALMDAMCYSEEKDHECSGYVFADGTAVLYINSDATHSTSSYPGPVTNYCVDGADVTVYNGNVVESTYHTHFNSPLFSNPISNPNGPNDQTTQSNNFPNSDLIILYNENIYIYHYEYGIYIP